MISFSFISFGLFLVSVGLCSPMNFITHLERKSLILERYKL